MDKQISTTTKDPYTRTHHISNNQYNKNKNQQNNIPADTTTKYNGKQNDKITKYRHSIKEQKTVLISKSHILLQSKANKNTETNPIKHNENKYCTCTHCTNKNNNAPIANTTVLPYPNISYPKIKQLPVTNIKHKKTERLRLNNNGKQKHSSRSTTTRCRTRTTHTVFYQRN